jgi:uncharacterized protein (DUF2336 family)
MTPQLATLTAVENAIATGWVVRRSALLRRVTDLFLVDADLYSDEEIARFDAVFNGLIVEIETSARALLAIRLGPSSHAPPKIIRTLAFDEAIEVAGPVLAQSPVLDEPTLVENAKTMGQEHLLAISQRPSLSEPVTDVLMDRGDQQVAWSTVANQGARFSEVGFGILVQRSRSDDRLALCMGARRDIPPQIFRELLRQASQQVRAKLDGELPRAKKEIGHAVSEATDRIEAAALGQFEEGKGASTSIGALHREGCLDDDAVRAFAEIGRIEQVTTALASLSQLPVPLIKQLIAREPSEIVLILARASSLSWPIARAILQAVAGKRSMSPDEIAQSLARFERLPPATAQKIVAFYQARQKSGTATAS